MPVIKTKNFILRPYRFSDAKALAKNINSKKIYRFTVSIPYPYALKDAVIFLKKIQQQNKKGEKFSLAIEINKEVVGSVALVKIIKNHRAELNYWLAEDYWNKGIMTKAAKEIVRYGFNKLKLKRIYAYVMAPNQASQKVLTKIGFKKEGLLKRHVKKDGRLFDLYIFAKVK